MKQTKILVPVYIILTSIVRQRHTEASCNEFGNYVGNEIDSEENVNYAGKCQKLCLEHSQCKFWTYDYSNKKCYRQTEKAATALGTCKTCIRGPRSCSDDRTFPNINCGESREHRDIPEDDNTNFQHVRGGENTLISKYPWMVSLGVYNGITDNYKHLCTASIINRKFVLTAAHCMVDESKANTFEGQPVLLFGTSDLASRRVGEHTFIKIKRTFTHPMYNARYAYYDVALLELFGDIKYSISQYPICLPQVASYNLEKRNGGFSILTGWGGGNSPLGKVVLEVLPQSACNRRYTVSVYDPNWRKINKTLPQLFQDNLLCAAYADKGSCHGDSGGPLVIEKKDLFPNRHVQIGIVTGAAACGDERLPSVYARVDHPDIWNFIYDTIQGNTTELTTEKKGYSNLKILPTSLVECTNIHVNKLSKYSDRTMADSGWNLDNISDGSIKRRSYGNCEDDGSWYGYKSGVDPIGSIKTKLSGCGVGILDFGECSRGSGDYFIQVNLNGNEIGRATSGQLSKTINVDFKDGDILELKEGTGYDYIRFNNFSVISCC